MISGAHELKAAPPCLLLLTGIQIILGPRDPSDLEVDPLTASLSCILELSHSVLYRQTDIF